MEENHSLILRALDPATDLDLFREAYSWRPAKTSKARPDRMAFEDFAASDPSQVVMGLFNGELQAVYLIRTDENGVCDTHFTCRRDAPKEYVLAGARFLLGWLLDNGAAEVVAFVTQRNTPLRRFVEAIGYEADGVSEFPCQNDTDGDNLPAMRKFIRYAAKR